MNNLLTVIRDENGAILNNINHLELIKEYERSNMPPDVYFCFVVKALIDDFGKYLEKATKNQINQEQFEAEFMINLNSMLSNKTRIESTTSTLKG